MWSEEDYLYGTACTVCASSSRAELPDSDILIGIWPPDWGTVGNAIIGRGYGPMLGQGF
jgi:hypothetical protein